MKKNMKIGLTRLLMTVSGGFLLFLAACDVISPRGNRNEAQPNVVLIITDDQPLRTLENMPVVQQELAAKGIRFSNAYVTTPLCSPSRSSILTGLYAQNTGVLTNRPGAPSFAKSNATLGVWFQQAGYRTGFMGKYLNNIDVLPALSQPGWDDYQIFWNRDKTYENPSFFYGYNFNENGTIVSYGKDPTDYSTDILTKKAAEFIVAAGEQPFFLTLSYYAPHYPYQSAERHLERFTTDADWQAFYSPNFVESDRSDKPAWLQGLKATKPDYAYDSDQAMRRSMLAVDEGIGKILDLLEKRQIRENTILIFLSDNGMSVGEHHIIGKDCPYDECSHVPFIISYPLLTQVARVEEKFVLNIDIAPTLIELAHLKVSDPLDGRSLVPLLTDAQIDWRDQVFIEHYQDTESDDPAGLSTLIPTYWALRSAEWKYIEYETGEVEIYDLVNDPYELQNLALLPEYQAVLQDLAQQLQPFRENFEK